MHVGSWFVDSGIGSAVRIVVRPGKTFHALGLGEGIPLEREAVSLQPRTVDLPVATGIPASPARSSTDSTSQANRRCQVRVLVVVGGGGRGVVHVFTIRIYGIAV